MSGGHQAAAGVSATETAGGAALPASIGGSATSISPTDATSTVSLNSSGAYSATVSPSGSGGSSGTWLQQLTSADYECRMTLTGDTGSVSGTLNTWQVLSSTRAWSIGTVAAGVKIVTGTLEIRRKIGQNVVASSAVGMSAARV